MSGAALTGIYAVPWGDQASVGRIDQGIDVDQSKPFGAAAAGTIVHIDPNFYNGTPAVYEKLAQPVTVNGRTYDEIYYSETPALVKVGQKVTAGTEVIGGGDAEIGFASGNLPAGHAQHVAGGDATVTTAGKDFKTFIDEMQSGAVTAVTDPVTGAVSGAAGAVSGAASSLASGIFSGLEGWLGGVAGKVLAYIVLVGVAGGLLLTGLKGLGVPVPKPTAIPLPVPA